MSYARGTKVGSAKTRLEIETYLERHKASSVAVGFQPGMAVVQFVMSDRRIRFTMKLTTPESFANVRRSKYGPFISQARRKERAEQANRERWRGLLLALKAKFTSLDQGIESFEQAFLAHIVLPDGKTVGEHALPAIEQAYLSMGEDMPPLLGTGTGP